MIEKLNRKVTIKTEIVNNFPTPHIPKPKWLTGGFSHTSEDKGTLTNNPLSKLEKGENFSEF